MIVILCDGSSKGNPGPASIGVVAWDRANNPRLINPNYRHTSNVGVKTSIEAEWLALLNAMEYALTKDRNQEVYIFSDAQTIVKQANGIWRVKHERIEPLYQSFLKLKSKLHKVSVNWIPRQLVSLADKLAQKGES